MHWRLCRVDRNRWVLRKTLYNDNIAVSLRIWRTRVWEYSHQKQTTIIRLPNFPRNAPYFFYLFCQYAKTFTWVTWEAFLSRIHAKTRNILHLRKNRRGCNWSIYWIHTLTSHRSIAWCFVINKVNLLCLGCFRRCRRTHGHA